MRFEVLRTPSAQMSMLVFWVVTPCGLVDRTNVSEENSTSIFMPYRWRDYVPPKSIRPYNPENQQRQHNYLNNHRPTGTRVVDVYPTNGNKHVVCF
jgi:hypothetical protein